LIANPHVVIKNLTIRNIYVITTGTDTSVAAQATYFIKMNASMVSDVTISNCTMTYSRWGVAVTGSNYTFANNDESYADHSMIIGGSGSYANVFVYGNHFHDWSIWDGPNPFMYHHDGLHFFTGGGGANVSNVNVYNNTFDGNNGGSMTGFIFAENSTTLSNVNIFNNVMLAQHVVNGGIIVNTKGDVFRVINNTMRSSAPEGSTQGMCFSIEGQTSLSLKNNAITTCGVQVNVNTGATFATGGLDYNLYANALNPSIPWAYNGTYYGSLGTWQTATGGDAHATYLTSAGLSSAGVPQVGSPVIGAGVNLYSLCNGQPMPGLGALCYDAVGKSRPASGPWDAGAYQSTSTTMVQPPTNLTVAGH